MMNATRREAAFCAPLILLAALTLRSAAAPTTGGAAAVSLPQQPQIINLSLLEALIAVEAQGLAGVFGYIPEANAAAAFADYLLHDQRALKLFIKKGRGDLKAAGGICEWDKQVFLYLVTLQSSPGLPDDSRLPDKLLARVSDLALAQPVPLHEITLRRRKRS